MNWSVTISPCEFGTFKSVLLTDSEKVENESKSFLSAVDALRIGLHIRGLVPDSEVIEREVNGSPLFMLLRKVLRRE